MFPMIIPKPIGTRSSGSHFLTMPRVMNTIPISIITRCCQVQLAKPVNSQNWLRLLITFSIRLW